MIDRPSSMRAQLNGSTSDSVTTRPRRASQSAMAQALPQAHWLTKCVVKAVPSTSRVAPSTWCPSDSQRLAVSPTAATQARSTLLPVGDAVMTAMRSRGGSLAAAAAKEGPRRGGAQ